MPARLSRRAFSRGVAGSAAAVWFAGPSPSRSAAAEPPEPTYPRMMQEYFEAKLPAHMARIKEEIAAVQSSQTGPEAAAKHAADVRARLAECFGPKPERTPLNATVTGALERDGYRVELITYESRPGLLVTAALYLPDGPDAGDGPFPGVLGVCGHSNLGKAYPLYQAFGVELAKAGFAALVIDPIGQGERFQWPEEGRDSAYGGTVGEHNQLDRLMRPTGEWFGSWRAWDGLRGIDLLAEREDVSISPFLGVTGNSGGGTLTCLVTAWDDRVTAAAPSCYVTTLARNLRNELPADAEQCPPHMLELGMDHHSFLVPTLLGEGQDGTGSATILAKRADFFDVRGAREAYGRLAQLAAANDTPDAAGITVAPGGHGFDPPLRRAMVEAFCQAAGRPVPPPFEFTEPEEPADLFATPEGSVLKAGSTPVWELLRGALPDATVSRSVDADVIRTALGLTETPTEPPPYDIPAWRSASGLPTRSAARFALRPEPHVTVPVLRLQDESMQGPPPKLDKPAVLLVAHRGAGAAFAQPEGDDPRASAFARGLPERFEGAQIYGCDVRGTGATEPGTVGPNEALRPYGSSYMYSAYARMWNEPILGGRVKDALNAWAFVIDHHAGDLHLCGDRWGAIPAALAAALLLEEGRKPASVTLSGLPPSWRALVEDERADWPYALLPFGVLKHFDLPDVLSRLREELGDGLTLENPAGPRGMAA
ncbi:alpha/beta hydrolase family protein [Alienimonas sp. DA493]|uniref:alpha/beta hydrolase family protein n=1 Tax=Alienimonas sp. DA493 TaxID=3373605 RepID=UPI003754BDE3